MRIASILIICTALICSAAAVYAEGSILIRPYGRAGYLLGGVNAEELDYVSADGDNLDDYLDVEKLNYGAGVQFFFKLSPDSPFRLGADLGLQNLFSSKFDTGAADLDFIDVSYDEDKEWSFYLLAMAEYQPDGMPFFFQGGVGVHMVRWTWEQTHSGTYSTSYESESGSGTSTAVMLAAGYNIVDSEKVSIPIMVRVDNIFRYDWLTYAGVMFGVTFKN